MKIPKLLGSRCNLIHLWFKVHLDNFYSPVLLEKYLSVVLLPLPTLPSTKMV